MYCCPFFAVKVKAVPQFLLRIKSSFAWTWCFSFWFKSMRVCATTSTPEMRRESKGSVERESRRVRARGLSRGNRYSRGPCFVGVALESLVVPDSHALAYAKWINTRSCAREKAGLSCSRQGLHGWLYVLRQGRRYIPKGDFSCDGVIPIFAAR